MGRSSRSAGSSPDAVVLDLNLPDSDGLATLRAVLASAPQLPVVVLTGVADVDIARQALQLGAQDWLVKGQLDPDVVQRAVRYAVERKRPDRSPGPGAEAGDRRPAGQRRRPRVQQRPHRDRRQRPARRGGRGRGGARQRPGSAAPGRPPGHRAEPAAAVAGPQSAVNVAVVSTAGLVESSRLLVQAVLPSTSSSRSALSRTCRSASIRASSISSS